MPVIQISLSKLLQYCKNSETETSLLDALPFLGLDIEDQVGDTIRVEYSPNRPDFSSEAGVARALVGLLGLELGPPKYYFPPSNFKINVVGDLIKATRPVVFGIYAEISVSDELIKQLITMQEDLHNGIGRKRSKVAIGIHNAEVISNSIKYHAIKDSNFAFIPLGDSSRRTIDDILTGTTQGQSYGQLLSKSYPILEDSNGNVLSMPPIINGELTRLKPGISKLFIDLTGTEKQAVDTSAAIIASMLSDEGAKVLSVEIKEGNGSFWTPDMSPKTIRFDLGLTNDVTGMDFTLRDAEKCLQKSRIGLYSNGDAAIPRYRHDIIHQIDLVEEVALGYGIQRFQPMDLKTSLVGDLHPKLKKQGKLVEILVGLGLVEVWNLSLTSKDQTSYCEESSLLRVENTKSKSFEYLRCELMPSLLSLLGSSIHQAYPQKIFELATTFRRGNDTISGVTEEEHVAVAVADSNANYSSIKSIVESFLKNSIPENKRISYSPGGNETSVFAIGRTAQISVPFSEKDEMIGHVGEVAPDVLERFGLKVPVVGFELNCEPLLKG